MPVITLSQLATGRWGNQVFCYMFGKTYARRHGLSLQVGPWVGNDLIGAADPPITATLPDVFEKLEHGVDDTIVPHASAPFRDVNFVGFFQYHTAYYAPDRNYIQRLFLPRPEIESRITPGIQRMRDGGRTLVAIHVRRGDYGKGYFYRTPLRWYVDQLERIWPQLERPQLYVASDDVESVLGSFASFGPLSSAHLGSPLSSSDFYRDFFVLQSCDVALIPNSSFSFAACMLNPRLRAAYRSALPAKGFVHFDPWNDKPLQQDRNAYVERYPHMPELWKSKSASKRFSKWVRYHWNLHTRRDRQR